MYRNGVKGGTAKVLQFGECDRLALCELADEVMVEDSQVGCLKRQRIEVWEVTQVMQVDTERCWRGDCHSQMPDRLQDPDALGQTGECVALILRGKRVGIGTTRRLDTQNFNPRREKNYVAQCIVGSEIRAVE